MLYRFKILGLLFLLVMLRGAIGFAQDCPDVKIDTLRLISLTYIDNSKESSAQVYYYIYGDDSLFEATNYILNAATVCQEPTCLKLGMLSVEDKALLKRFTLLKQKQFRKSKLGFKKFIEWNCVSVRAKYFTFSCKNKTLLLPLNEFTETGRSICIINFMSKDIRASKLPESVLKIVEDE